MFLRSLVALVVSVTTSSAALASFDPESYTTDASLFADLVVQDYQTLSPTWWSEYTESDPLVVDDLAYWGYVWPANDWCIPGMDDGGYSCGGTNVYLASAVDLHIQPQVPIDRIGFRFGSQGGNFFFVVTLSDGSQRTFEYVSDTVDPWGNPYQATGFFGYGTGDASLTIDHIYLYAADGGIDDIRYGVAGPSGACDDLEAAIFALNLDRGIERSLIAKAESADGAAVRGQPEVAKRVLEALIAEIGAQSGGHIDPADAETLIACVQARTDAL